MINPLIIDKDQFGADPFGYAAGVHQTWGILCTANGFPVDINAPATIEDLKNPILWMSHGHALSTAAMTLLTTSQNFSEMPFGIKSICYRQYCAVALMLVGYSLEVYLKSMQILKNGIEKYIEEENKTKHHNLEKLSQFIPDLSDKDKAILKNLTHFVYWAGRYPDPGKSRISDAEEIFDLSETFQITAADVFELSIRISKYTKNYTENIKHG